MMRKPMTMDDYLASRWIVDPFRMFDCCLETDGAVAIVLVRADRAKDLPHRPVLVQGAAWGGGITVVNNGHVDITESPAKPIAERLYAAAGLGPSDIEFAELYDCFTYNVLSQIEGYGFAEPGSGTGDAGRRRVRSSIGLAAAQHARRPAVGGLHPRDEPRVRGGEQIRGEAGHRQVAAPRRRARHRAARLRERLLVGGSAGGCVMADVTERRTLPTPDRDSAPYWAALADGRVPVAALPRLRALDLAACVPSARAATASDCRGSRRRVPARSTAGWSRISPTLPTSLASCRTRSRLVRVDEQDDILIPGRYVSDDVDIYQGLRVRAVPERVTDEIGVLQLGSRSVIATQVTRR